MSVTDAGNDKISPAVFNRRKARLNGPTYSFWLVRQLELHRNLGLDLNWRTVEQVGFVFPLLYRVKAGVCELRVSAEHTHRGDAAAFRDRRHQFDRAFNPQPKRIGRIFRLYLFE